MAVLPRSQSLMCSAAKQEARGEPWEANLESLSDLPAFKMADHNIQCKTESVLYFNEKLSHVTF